MTQQTDNKTTIGKTTMGKTTIRKVEKQRWEKAIAPNCHHHTVATPGWGADPVEDQR